MIFKMKNIRKNMKINDIKYFFDIKESLFENIINDNDLNEWVIIKRKSLSNEILEIILIDILYYIIYS